MMFQVLVVRQEKKLRMSVADMGVLRSMSGVVWEDMVRNECVRDSDGITVASEVDKITENGIQLFELIMRRK